MPATPNYGFHRHPRFSVNHVAEYVTTETAGQRENVIRAAKFPRKTAVVPYTPSRRAITRFLTDNTDNFATLDEEIARFESRIRREPDGWMKSELRRNVDAIEAFKEAFATTKAKRCQFAVGPGDVTMRLEGVRINARLDLILTETDGAGVTYSGGCVLLIAATDAARKRIEDRCKIVAALIHWTLDSPERNIETLERLCLSFDVFGRAITPAPKAVERLRSHIRSACQEAAARWPRVAPPPGYDGPDWQ